MQCSDEPKSINKKIKSNVQTPASRLLRTAIVGSLVTGLSVAPQALLAQGGKRASSALLEEVVVTARKREENSQDVPLAISAFSSDQLDALKVRSLEGLSVGSPNVSLDDAGTSAGYANFSIRGLGINSSIVSIDPTVGLFVDGIYLGIPAGTVLDLFDLESIEVLRGPQGTLFGRNVTGGAVIINTKLPGDEPEFSVKGAVEGGGDGGLKKVLAATAGGPLSSTFAGKVSVYQSDDDGYFENQFDGEDFGASEQKVVRLAGVYTPTDSTEFILRLQNFEARGDGPAGQSHVNAIGAGGLVFTADRDSFDFSVDEVGFADVQSDSVSLETNIDIGFGDGTITNIVGYRKYDAETFGDIDSQPIFVFHSGSFTENEQWSNELRYNGLFAEQFNVTVGTYYFTSDTDYHERRLFGASGAQLDGGGLLDTESASLFGTVDYDLSEALTLTAGLRYTYEKKEAIVAGLLDNIGLTAVPASTCKLVSPEGNEGSCNIGFVDEESWTYASPKLGARYTLSDSSHVYGHWARGIRSGGYNVRNTSPNEEDTPGPFDEETTDAFEIGYKATYSRGRLNAAIFYNDVKDLQRELNLPGTDFGTVQIIRNTADAEIYGLELDGAFSITPSLLLTGSIGITESEYTEVIANLVNVAGEPDTDGDGVPGPVINSADENLDLPRAPELTYSIGLNYDFDIGSAGYVASRLSYAYRDESAYTDDNAGFILSQEILNFGMDFYSADETWSVGIYGKNLLDDVKHGGDTNLSFGGTFAPLAKGRIIGAEFTYNF